MAGVAATGGYLLAALPNVEIMTAVLFTAGYAVGRSLGVLSAVVASLIYFGLNPQGGLFPPLLAAQILGMSAAPLAGASWHRWAPAGWPRHLLLGAIALTLTLWYDLLTNLAFPLAVGFDKKGILLTLAAGIPFSAIHIASNALIFVFLVPPLLQLVQRGLAAER